MRSITLPCVLLIASSCASSAPVASAPQPPSPSVAPVNSGTKADGRFLFGGAPTAQSIEQAKNDGVKVIISNLSPDETQQLGFDEAKACAAAGIEWVNIPTKPDHIDVAAVDAFAKVVESTPGDGGAKVLTHCKSGNRAAGLYAAYLARHQKVPLEEAIARAKALGLSKEPTIESVKKVAAEP